MDKKTLAIGILIGIAIMGCIAAVNSATGSAGRYPFPPNYEGDRIETWVLDTQTGEVTHFRISFGEHAPEMIGRSLPWRGAVE
jgi:hypothetical protein